MLKMASDSAVGGQWPFILLQNKPEFVKTCSYIEISVLD